MTRQVWGGGRRSSRATVFVSAEYCEVGSIPHNGGAQYASWSPAYLWDYRRDPGLRLQGAISCFVILHFWHGAKQEKNFESIPEDKATFWVKQGASDPVFLHWSKAKGKETGQVLAFWMVWSIYLVETLDKELPIWLKALQSAMH